MTTSPFGTPNPFASPQAPAEAPSVAVAAAPPGSRSKRTPLLIGLVGVAAAAAVGSGLFFFTQSGDDTSNETEIALPAGPDVAPPAPVATPTDTSTPLPTLTQFNGRNPFAAQVVPGGKGAAPASKPVATTAPSSGSSAFTGGGGTGSSGSSGGSAAGVNGKDGVNGRNGADGKDGKDGADGRDGVTPQYVGVTFRAGVVGVVAESFDDMADFEVLTPAGVVEVDDAVPGDLLAESGPGSWVEFIGLQLDADDQPVLARLQIGDRLYDVPLNQPVTLFQAAS